MSCTGASESAHHNIAASAIPTSPRTISSIKAWRVTTGFSAFLLWTNVSLMGKWPVKLGILAVGHKQFSMCPALDDSAVLDNQNAVGFHDRALAVGDDERSASGQQLFQRFLHKQFSSGVDGAGGFVEHEDS